MSRPIPQFWAFVKRRQQAWAAKHGRAPAVRDPVLASVRFANVFRALDRGTLFSIYELLPLGPAQRVWSVLMYRAMNRIDSFQALVPWTRTANFSAGSFLSNAEVWRFAGYKVFTGVYYSSHVLHGAPYPAPGTPMTRRLAAYGEELAAGAEQLADMLGGVGGLEEACRAMRQATVGTLLGPFMVHQAALDLDYKYGWPDDWVHVGPGAKKGLALLGYGFHRTALDALRTLAGTQPEIPYAPRGMSSLRPVALALPDVEHALCEWMKYERIKAGGHARGAYDPHAHKPWSPPSPVPPWWRLPNAS